MMRWAVTHLCSFLLVLLPAGHVCAQVCPFSMRAQFSIQMRMQQQRAMQMRMMQMRMMRQAPRAMPLRAMPLRMGGMRPMNMRMMARPQRQFQRQMVQRAGLQFRAGLRMQQLRMMQQPRMQLMRRPGVMPGRLMQARRMPLQRAGLRLVPQFRAGPINQRARLLQQMRMARPRLVAQVRPGPRPVALRAIPLRRQPHPGQILNRRRVMQVDLRHRALLQVRVQMQARCGGCHHCPHNQRCGQDPRLVLRRRQALERLVALRRLREQLVLRQRLREQLVLRQRLREQVVLRQRVREQVVLQKVREQLLLQQGVRERILQQQKRRERPVVGFRRPERVRKLPGLETPKLPPIIHKLKEERVLLPTRELLARRAHTPETPMRKSTSQGERLATLEAPVLPDLSRADRLLPLIPETEYVPAMAEVPVLAAGPVSEKELVEPPPLPPMETSTALVMIPAPEDAEKESPSPAPVSLVASGPPELPPLQRSH